MKTKLIFSLLIIAIGTACKKEPLPVAVQADPVFYIKANVSGAPALSLEAGENGVVLNSSFSRTADNLYVYEAFIGADCNNCGYKVGIKINDYRITGEKDAMRPDSGLRPGSYFLFDKSRVPTSEKMEFQPEMPDAGAGAYTWTVSDGVSAKTYETYSISPDLSFGKTYSVSFRFVDYSGACSASHTNVFTPGDPFSVSIQGSQQAIPTSYKFVANFGSVDDYTYTWDFGDGSPAETGKVVYHNYVYPSDGPFRVKVTAKNSSGRTVSSYYQATAQAGACQANFNAVVQPQDLSYLLSAVTVTVTDPSGKTYSSADFQQPPGAKITISEVSDYLPNSKGEKTKRVKLGFECVVKDGSNVLTLKDGEAVIAVSYR